MKTKLFCPIGKALSFAFVCEFVIASCISHLFVLGSPNAVALFISSVIIEPFNAVLPRWALTHILEETLEGQPAFAHSNSDSAVIFVVPDPWVCASLDDTGPQPVYGCPASPMCATSAAEGCINIAMQAPAAFRVPRYERILEYKEFVSAFASATPARKNFSCGGVVSSRFSDDYQASKGFIEHDDILREVVL